MNKHIKSYIIMAEECIKTKSPELHNLIKREIGRFEWEQIKNDLEKISWLIGEDFKYFDTTLAIWEILDDWAAAELTLVSRFNLFKLAKVKHIIGGFYSKVPERQQIKDVCRACSEKLGGLGFLKNAIASLNAAGQDSFSGIALRIYDTFNEIKKIARGIFMHFEKYIKSELNKHLVELMDKPFEEMIFQEFKIRLNQDPTTKKRYSEYDKYEKATASRDDSQSHAFFAPKGTNVYTGELNEHNEREGYGKIQYYSGDTYEGSWVKNKRQGEGLYNFKFGGRYKGEFDMDLPSGQGCKTYNSGNVYTGMFLLGKKQGQGVMTFKNGDVYEGNWDNDDMHGQGKYTWTSGDYFVGNFNRDKREGPGALYLNNGETIEGLWKNGVLSSS